MKSGEMRGKRKIESDSLAFAYVCLGNGGDFADPLFFVCQRYQGSLKQAFQIPQAVHLCAKGTSQRKAVWKVLDRILCVCSSRLSETPSLQPLAQVGCTKELQCRRFMDHTARVI